MYNILLFITLYVKFSLTYPYFILIIREIYTLQKEYFMKRYLLPSLTLALLAFAASCTSVVVVTETVPLFYTNNESAKFEILGEVMYESRNRVAGYTDLLRAARNLYSDCDYVIDIMIDQKRTATKTIRKPFLGFIGRMSESTDTETVYIMRATAIKYVY